MDYNIFKNYIKDLLLRSWNLFRKRFATVFQILLILNVPYLVFLAIIRLLSGTQPNPNGAVGFTMGFFSPSPWDMGFFITFVGMILMVIEAMALVYLSVKPEGETAGWKGILKQAFSNAPLGVGICLMTEFFVFLWTCLLIIPGIISGVYYFFVLHAALLRDKKGLDTIHYSCSLIKGNWWRTFGIMILLILVSHTVALLVRVPVWLISGMLPENYLGPMSDFLMQKLVNAFLVISSTLFFLDCEREKNNFSAQGA